ncbi:MAG: DUF362 domain-containing protein [Candidatus Marinimicrobia bacterium]|nr:DUF362 domain-containing protein [Candidatus Neomarinimicrobiota bacterium]
MSKKTASRLLTFGLILFVWFYWDFSQAEKRGLSPFRSYKYLSEFDAVTAATTKVSIVRSDDPELIHPIPTNDESIDYDEIESMVMRAIKLAGGFDWVIEPDDVVLLKPNIVDPEPPGSGEVTDVRVIKALIKIIDEINPGNIEIIVGEGSPRPMDYEMDYQSKFSSPQWDKLWDAAGYQDLLTDPYLDGINFRFSNLNGSPPENPWQDLVEVEVPGGGVASPQDGKYFVHKDILDADVFITVPVMKIHTPGITVALKNQIGLAPSTLYGFSKTAGVLQDNYQHKLIHGTWTDKEIVDLSHLAQIKFVVVDAIACLEREKTARRQNGVITNLVRMNTIVAGTDPVAVDHVCTRLMGMNPDDIEHITLAERIGLGTNDPENIHIVGTGLEQARVRFIKTPSPEGDFGQSNRIWLLNGPYSIKGISDPINYLFIENEFALRPESSQNGWSEPIYFMEDRIDLYDYFNLTSSGDVVSYAFSYFDAPKDQEAELWIGSDEALIIYINGQAVYSYNSTRSFSGYYSVKVKAPIKAGENTLLVKALQKYGRYDFSLNICEPETDPNFDGNRVWGLRFKTTPNSTAVKQREIQTTLSYELQNAYPNPFNSTVRINYQISSPGPMYITVYNLKGQIIRTLLNENIVNAGEKMIFWDGTDDYGHIVATGLYLVTFQRGGHSIISKKIMFLK